jgi:hypothetical protein
MPVLNVGILYAPRVCPQEELCASLSCLLSFFLFRRLSEWLLFIPSFLHPFVFVYSFRVPLLPTFFFWARSQKCEKRLLAWSCLSPSVRPLRSRPLVSLLNVDLRLYNFILLHFWNILSDDGCVAQPKHVDIYVYCNIESCVDGLCLYYYKIYIKFLRSCRNQELCHSASHTEATCFRGYALFCRDLFCLNFYSVPIVLSVFCINVAAASAACYCEMEPIIEPQLSLIEHSSGTVQKFPFGVYTTIEQKNITASC